jgi:uncharacterized protein (DUF2384 family)
MEDALLVEIERLGEAVWERERVDGRLLEAGMTVHGNEAALALWLVRPAPALDYRVPLSLIAKAEGQEEVLDLLAALEREGRF